jgi:hypothetical protein
MRVEVVLFGWALAGLAWVAGGRMQGSPLESVRVDGLVLRAFASGVFAGLGIAGIAVSVAH